MGVKLCHITFCVWFITMRSSNAADLTDDLVDLDLTSENHWVYQSTKPDLENDSCYRIQPTPRDIVRRIFAILPYFDREHMNKEFLYKFRGTIHGMSEGDDPLDREVAFYAAALTPLVFLQQYRDTWCLLERFLRAMRRYQISYPTDKRSALKLLQNFRAVSHKVQMFIRQLPGPSSRPRTTTSFDSDDEELHNRKDIRYLKELIKNLG